MLGEPCTLSTVLFANDLGSLRLQYGPLMALMSSSTFEKRLLQQHSKICTMKTKS